MPKEAPLNGGAPRRPVPVGPCVAGTGMQTKLHRWAAADPGRRFDDLFNFVCDPARCWWRGTGSRATRGATAGVDGLTVADVEERIGVQGFLDELRGS